MRKEERRRTVRSGGRTGRGAGFQEGVIGSQATFLRDWERLLVLEESDLVRLKEKL